MAGIRGFKHMLVTFTFALLIGYPFFLLNFSGLDAPVSSVGTYTLQLLNTLPHGQSVPHQRGAHRTGALTTPDRAAFAAPTA